MNMTDTTKLTTLTLIATFGLALAAAAADLAAGFN